MTADGKTPPVLHVDSDTSRWFRTVRGRPITRELWGVYFKRDTGPGCRVGAVPLRLGARMPQVDLYGPASPHYTAERLVRRLLDREGLAHCLARFEGKS